MKQIIIEPVTCDKCIAFYRNGQEAGYLPVEQKFVILPPTHSRLWLFSLATP